MKIEKKSEDWIHKKKLANASTILIGGKKSILGPKRMRNEVT